MRIRNLINRPLFVMVNKLRMFFGKIENALDRKNFTQINLKKNQSWTKLFNNQEFFEYKFDDNIKINLYKDSLLSKVIYDGFEKDETDYMKTVLKPGDVFLDIGSNIGLFSLIASKLIGSSGKVISFEPTPLTFARFKENVKINEIKNIELRNLGLSDSKGELKFYISKNGHDAWNSFAPSQDTKLEDNVVVQVSTLNAELEKIEKNKIKLVKIDVEGWEKFVLKGGEDFFINYNPIVMMEFTEENTFNAGYSVHELYDIMESYGFKWYNLINGELLKHKRKMHYPYDNLIAIKGN